MSAEVSSTRLYLGNLPRDVTKEDIQNHFKDGTGNITEIKLMNGFGFIEYDDALDARDVVPGELSIPTRYQASSIPYVHPTFTIRSQKTTDSGIHKDGSDMNGSRLTVQFARGSRQRDFPAPDRTHPRPRRTAYRMQISGLPGETSWQDLKDFARRSGLDVVYSEVGRDRDGKGFVEFETAGDLKVAVDKLDNQDFKGASVRCLADTQDEIPRNDRYRSRSPPSFRRGGGYPPSDGYYGRGPPPSRGYSPRRDDYRRRSPPRDDYYSRHSSYRSPPPPRAARPPIDDPYPPPARGGYRDDPYGAPPRRGYEDPYAANGYDRPRARSPPRAYGGYDERPPPPRYW